MNLLSLPWVELAVALPLVTACGLHFVKNIELSWRVAVAMTSLSFFMSILAWASTLHEVPSLGASYQSQLFGHVVLRLDWLGGPLFVLVALLHLLTILTTAKVKMTRLSFSGHLLGESIRMATFACIDPWPLIVLLSLAALPPYREMVKRKKPTRVFLIHMLAFIVLLVVGWVGVERHATWGPVVLMFAVLLRSGTFPLHLWVSELLEHATFGTAILFLTPIAGMYAALRLVFPVSPDWVMQTIGILSLVTAIYAAGLALVQTDPRRFFAQLFLSHSSLVLVGLELHTPLSLTGALFLWPSVALSLGGLGMVLRAIEARHGKLSLKQYHGLYEQSPSLAVGFALMGLGSVGFPGTLGFVAAELLVDGAISSSIAVGIVLVIAGALNGIAILRIYFLIFTGPMQIPTIPIGITLRERFGILVLGGLLLGGGLMPQIGVEYFHKVARALQNLPVESKNVVSDPLTVERSLRDTPPPEEFE